LESAVLGQALLALMRLRQRRWRPTLRARSALCWGGSDV